MKAEKNHYKRAALTLSLIFATLGLLCALLILALFDGINLAMRFPIPIFTGVIGLYSAAYCFGLVAGNLINQFEGQGLGVWCTGIGLAWICLLISALAGSAVEFLPSHRNWQDFGDYIFKPLFWVMLVGIIPALILGVGYTAAVKKFIRLKIH